MRFVMRDGASLHDALDSAQPARSSRAGGGCNAADGSTSPSRAPGSARWRYGTEPTGTELIDAELDAALAADAELLDHVRAHADLAALLDDSRPVPRTARSGPPAASPTRRPAPPGRPPIGSVPAPSPSPSIATVTSTSPRSSAAPHP